MAQPKRARRTFSGRAYTWKGEEYPSVTSILRGGIPAPALTNWMIAQTAERAVELADDLAKLAAADRDGVLHLLKQAHKRPRDKAANLGTQIHEAVESYIMGAPPPKPLPEAEPYLAQFQEFLATVKPQFVAAECTVFNRTYRYAGTLDAIAIIDGTPTLLDWKTGKGVYPESSLQLTAYSHGEFYVERAKQIPLPDIQSGAVLHLGSDQWELIPVRIDEQVFAYFCCAIGIYRWMNNIGRQAVGEPSHSSEEPSRVFEPRLIAGERSPNVQSG